MTLERRFHNLRRTIEGLRIRNWYETDYFIPLEEELGCVPVNAWHGRILSELDFCLQMKAYAGVDVEKEVDECLRVLEEAEADGAFPDSVCRRAEEKLLPLGETAKKYKLILAGHAHIDMNWKWSWDETVAATVATFTTMLSLMEEYPFFHYSQSQASTYRIVEEYAPWLMDGIRQRIKEGRWEVLASHWVEPDKNLPCMDSLCNQIYYAKEYLQKHWGIDPSTLDIDFSPDAFGHSAFIPSIDALGGIRYMYHMRGVQDVNLAMYRWRAPSGEELLVYKEPYNYSHGLYPTRAIGLPRIASLNGGFQTGLLLYGVGDHGGGPTRRDLNRGAQMAQWPVFPVLKFGTVREFFQEAEAARACFPVKEGELNCVFTGCYTSQSRIKRGNRRAENSLLTAERMSALAAVSLNAPYWEEGFEKAWRGPLLNHFHDIVTGSCIRDTREYAMGLYQQSFGRTDALAARALERIAAETDTSHLCPEDDGRSRSEGAGAGFGIGSGNIPTHESGGGKNRIYTIFNPTDYDREEAVKITVWDWPGSLPLMEFSDSEGRTLPSQRISDWIVFWAHRYFEALVSVNVPANGYTTVVLREKDPEIETDCYVDDASSRHQHMPFEDIVLENEYIRAVFDRHSGQLSSLVDKETGEERIRPGETGGLRLCLAQMNSESSWIIGRWLQVCEITDLRKLEPSAGELSSGLQMEHMLGDSKVETWISLGRKDRFLRIRLRIDWKEASNEKDLQPVLYYGLPLKDVTGRMLCDVPGGVIWRTGGDLDMPCQRYAAAECGDGRTVVLGSDCTYGYRLDRGNLYAALINVSAHPDPYPERGIHEVTLFVMPYSKNAVGLSSWADRMQTPLQYASNTVHTGSLPLEHSFLRVSADSAAATGVSCKGGLLTVRIEELLGKECPVLITLDGEIKNVFLGDLFGRQLPDPVRAEGNTVSFILKPFVHAQLFIEK